MPADVMDGTIPPDVVSAFRQLRADLQPEPDVVDLVARNVNLTFCWSDNDGIAAGDECPALTTDFPCEINGWTVAGKRSETGSASFTVYAGLYADYPAPVSIVGAAPPAVSGAVKAEGSIDDVASWDHKLPRHTVLVAVPDSISGFTRMTLSLRARRLDL